MCETVFMAKCRDGNWRYGYPYPAVGADKGKWLLTEVCDNLESSRTFEVDPKTICACTGVHDCNGDMIFNGHIVKVPPIDPIFGDFLSRELTKNAEIKFDRGMFYVEYDHGYHKISLQSFNEKIEIIGNVFDNPELLGG